MINEKASFFTNEILSKLVSNIGIAFWVWDVVKDNVYYNDAYFDLVGYPRKEGAMEFEIWKQIVHPDDFDRACGSLMKYHRGESDSYGEELRYIKKNGDLLWVYDTGKIIKMDENNNPAQIAGVIQDITKRKQFEHQLKKDENKLRLAMQFAGFSVWEWDIENNEIFYDKDYAKSLGYKSDKFTTSIKDWTNIVHPEDIFKITSNIRQCLTGQGGGYDHKLRIKKADGEYTWVRDIAEVSCVNIEGRPITIIGGRLDINDLEIANLKLEKYHEDLEIQIKNRTGELYKRDQSLLELNEVSRKLMEATSGSTFLETVYSCLDDFSSLGEDSRLTIFKNKVVDGKPYCFTVNENQTNYTNNFTIEQIREFFKDVSISFLSGGVYDDSQREEYYRIMLSVVESISFSDIDYQRFFPTIYKHVKEDKPLNFDSSDIYRIEFIFARLQGVKSMLMCPISINNKPWGFMLLDSPYENAFSDEDAKILSLVGSVFGQAIHKSELEVKANEAIEHNRLMLNALPICCNLWKDGVNIGTNDEAVRLFDLTSQEEYLENFYLLAPKYQPCGRLSSELADEYVSTAAETGYIKFEWMHQKFNGEPVPCEVILVKIPDGDKGYVIAGYTRDLREFKALMRTIEETQENLKQAHEEALLSSKAKSNFLANMSHEIRTPMNAISGMTDIILREANNDEVVSYAENIKRASESLLAIINDVLDISKIESGKIDIIEGEYSLSDVLNDVLTIATNRLELKPLMFVSNFQHDLPNNLIGDDTRVKQVMVNILNNAIKFTSKGSITFEVSGHFAGGVLELEFSVTDTGVGISDDDIEKLFIEFERVNTKKNRAIEGTGLGLAISKRLCEMMNGTIEVTSELGVGTTFTIRLLQQYKIYAPISKIEAKKSVLVFESRDIYRNSIKKACDDLALDEVVLCSLQSEVNEALQEKEFDFILTSAMYLLKVQELVNKFELKSKIVLLADTNDIKSKYDYRTIVLPANSISIADVINGKTKTNSGNKSENNFTAPECVVLVVDDNLVNLKVAQGLMRPYQFKIETAENGQEAVEKIKNKKYDLVFMDHMMPIMDGIDATTTVRNFEGEQYQNLPIIALTANAIIGTREMFINEGMNDFLAKPIKISALNDILSKWLPKEKQLKINDDSDELAENSVDLKINSVDVQLGINRVGGDYNTYVDILNMYYKDGLKRVHSIRNFYDHKQLQEYKIEVHALKSASASVGAMDISEKARLLEEASITADWTYINQYALEFIDDFNILLENIRESLLGVVSENDNTDKPSGDNGFYIKALKELAQALDSIDINACDDLIEELFSYSWDDDKNNILNKINDLVSGYEYDEAVEIIENIEN